MEAVRRIRTMRGMNQVDLAKASGVAQNTISEIELGKREARPGTLKKLADALDVEIADLFEDGRPLAQAPPEEEQRPKTITGSASLVGTGTLSARGIRIVEEALDDLEHGRVTEAKSKLRELVLA